MNLANHDLRAWMKEVESINELHRIPGIPWDKDIGGLLEMILERSKHPPALLFENIPDARPDMSILCSQIDGIKRLALAMGNDPKLGVTDFIQAWRKKVRNLNRWSRSMLKTRRYAKIASKRILTSKLFRSRAGRRNGSRRPSAGQGFHRSIQRSALIWNALEDAGVPDVTGVWLHPGAYRFFSIVKIKQRYPGHAKQAALVASQCRPGAYLGRYIVVVDDDIDIHNSDDVIWAISTRSEPENIDILRRCWSGPLDPAIPRERKGFNSRAIIDATRPYEWRNKFRPVNAVSDALKDELNKKYAPLLQEILGNRH